MKAENENELSLWGIIERLQRRLERQGMTATAADRAVAIAIRSLASARGVVSQRVSSLEELTLASGDRDTSRASP